MSVMVGDGSILRGKRGELRPEYERCPVTGRNHQMRLDGVQIQRNVDCWGVYVAEKIRTTYVKCRMCGQWDWHIKVTP